MYRTKIEDMQYGDTLLVSLEYYQNNAKSLKGIPLTITLDGKEPLEHSEEPLEHSEEPEPQPIEEVQSIDQRIEKLEIEQEHVIDLLAQALGV